MKIWNFYQWKHWKYEICISFDLKSNFPLSAMEIFWIRPRKFGKSPISQNAWVESKFWMKIRTCYEISHWMIYYDNRSINTWRRFQWILISTPTQSLIRMKTLTVAGRTHHHNISFDRRFYDELEFLFKISFPPTHFELSAISQICVGGFKKFSLHWMGNWISSRMICLFHMFNICIGLNSKFSKNDKYIISHDRKWIFEKTIRRQ